MRSSKWDQANEIKQMRSSKWDKANEIKQMRSSKWDQANEITQMRSSKWDQANAKCFRDQVNAKMCFQFSIENLQLPVWSRAWTAAHMCIQPCTDSRVQTTLYIYTYSQPRTAVYSTQQSTDDSVQPAMYSRSWTFSHEHPAVYNCRCAASRVQPFLDI